jgi:hypothetical protein
MLYRRYLDDCWLFRVFVVLNTQVFFMQIFETPRCFDHLDFETYGTF